MVDKKKINLGFDIGVASVGWSIIDEDYNILDMGVRLFDDPADPKDGTLKNETRRKSRQLRRQIRRAKKRKDDLIYLFIKNNLVENEDEFYKIINKPLYLINPNVKSLLELRVNGLTQKLNNNELLIVLFNYLSHRGFFYEVIEKEDNAEKENKENNVNYHYDPHKLPSVQLKEFYDKYGWYKNLPYITQIPNKAYVDELTQFLNTQNLSEQFKQDYLEIFTRMRSYTEGPGSKNSPTPYGLYRKNAKGKVEKIGDNLWAYTIGKCTVYPNEIRGAKNAPIAQVYNLLNELNNLEILNNENNKKLSHKQKMDLFSLVQNNWIKNNKQKNITLKEILKVIYPDDKPEDHFGDIDGYRQTSYENGKDPKKADFQKLNNYFETTMFLLRNNIINSNEIKLLDETFLNKINEIFEAVRQNQDPNKAIDAIKALDAKYGVISNEAFNEYFKKLKGISQSHSLSYKAMLKYIAFGINNSENQMNFFADIIQQNQKALFKDKKLSKYVPTGLFDEEIISPTARRAFNQTIAVLNKILKKYNKNYDLENITIELARDKNTKEEQAQITKLQNKNKAVLDVIKEQVDNPKAQENFDELNYDVKRKLKLLKQQDNQDIYDGEYISYNDVILNPQKYDIDHIIPFSISGDNSLNNTVITKKYNNHDKGNKTPYYWLSANNKWNEFQTRVKTNNNFSITKKNNLLYMDNPLKNAINFVNRNLVDTRYASKLVLNVLQDFFSNYKNAKDNTQNLYQNTKVKVLNGSITHYARYNLFLQDKKREFNYHHAIDATIMNFLGMSSQIKKDLERSFQFNKYTNTYSFREMDVSHLINDATGEIFSKQELFNKQDPIVRKVELQMNDYKENDKVKFSRLLKTKKNIDLSDQTIYSFKYDNNDEGHIINKLNLVGTDDTTIKNLKKYFGSEVNEEDLKNLVIYTQNKNLYEKLKIIYQENFDPNKKTNPFVQYMMKLQPEFKSAKFVKIDGLPVVKKLQILGDNKTTDNIIILKNHSNKGIMQSLKPLAVRIYKNNKNKLVLLPINQKVLSFKNNKMYIDNQKIDAILSSMQVDDKNKFLVINNGTTLLKKDDNKLYWCNGGGFFKQNKLEIKKLYELQEKQTQIAISTIISTFVIIELDILGHRYKEIDIKKYFNL